MTSTQGKAAPQARKSAPARHPPRGTPVTAARRYLRALGPGLVTGASDDDPSGVATYAQAGAQTGFGLLWTALLTLPLMTAIQEICDRTALTTGKGLGELASLRFPRQGRAVVAVMLAALLLANALNIAADLVAVGSGMHLLHLGPTTLWACLAGVAITALLIAGQFPLLARIFKVLCVALLSYLVVAVVSHPALGALVRGLFIPHLRLDRSDISLLVAVLGTTISPYLFFWQSAHRIEELRDEPEGGNRVVLLRERTAAGARRKTRSSRADVFTGMAFSNVVMLAIMISAAATLHAKGITNVATPAAAAQSLRPIAGSFAETLFALGFIGSGMLAVPVLAASGSVGLAGLLGRSWGFDRSPRKAPLFYGLVVFGTIGGVLLSALHVSPIRLLIVSAAINGVAAAPFVVMVMLISGSRAFMGKHRNGRLATTLGWCTAALMTAAAVAFLVTL